MKNNIAKVAERGERLDSLQDKTGTFCVCGLVVHGRNCITMKFFFLLTKSPQKTLLSLLKDSVEEQTGFARYVISLNVMKINSLTHKIVSQNMW